MKRILLTGGGSGGHIYPLIAVAQKLREIAAAQSIEVELRYMGPIDIYSAYLTQENIPIARIANAKLRRYFSFQNFIDGPKFLYSILQAFIKVALFWPHVAFSKGGPGALPVLLACRAYGIPIIIHESDSVPGVTNRITGKWAQKIELAWEKAKEYFSPIANTAIVGIPLRNDLLRYNKTQHDSKIDLALDPHELVILVVGGSQGAQRINDCIMENLPELLEKYQIIHQVGSNNYHDYLATYESIKKSLPEKLQKKYHIWAYLEENMATAYAAADCIIARSGSSVFEFASFGKPSILIPLTESANDHQRVNGYEYAKAGAAIVIEENNLGVSVLFAQLEKILGDSATREKMSAAARAFATLDAAQKIAEDILTL